MEGAEYSEHCHQRRWHSGARCQKCEWVRSSGHETIVARLVLDDRGAQLLADTELVSTNSLLYEQTAKRSKRFSAAVRHELGFGTVSTCSSSVQRVVFKVCT